MATPLRDYQLGTLALHATAVRELRGSPRRAVLDVLPTGAGKTVTAMTRVHRVIQRGGRVLWLACLDILLGQAESNAQRFGIDPGRVQAGSHDISRALTIGSVQTVIRRLDRIPAGSFDLVVFDEAHRAMAPSSQAILAHFTAPEVMGLTATPFRLDGKGLGDAGFGRIVAPVTPELLVDRGFLAPVAYWRAGKPDLSGLRRRAGEFTTDTAERVMAPGLADVQRGILEHFSLGRIAVFPVSVAHSKALVAALRDVGVDAHHIDAQTGSDERERLLAPGGAHVVSSVGVLDEGVDAPGIAVVVLAAPTASAVRFLQRIGRGMRPKPGGAACVVLDYGDNFSRHFFPTDDVRWMYDLDGAPPAEAAAKKAVSEGLLLLSCDACGRVYKASSQSSSCVWCGKDQEVAFLDAKVQLERVFAPRKELVARSADEIEAGQAWRQAVAVASRRGYAEAMAVWGRRTGAPMADRKKMAWLRMRFPARR